MARRGGEFVLATLWLSRLPVGRWLPDPAPGLPQALWAFPLVGCVVGALAGGVYAFAAWVGLSLLVAAILALGAQIWLTGGLHEDGLADLADGMGGATPEARLAIMRDSRIGSYGMLALVMVLGLRVAMLASLSPTQAVAALVAVAALSRAGIVAVLHVLPPARADGLGRGAGRAGRQMVIAALVLAALPALLFTLTGIWGMAAVGGLLLGGMTVQVFVAWQSMRALGGQTGDVLGAVQQGGEAGAMLGLLVCVG